MSRINRGYYMPLFILFIMLYYIVTNLNEVITTKQYIDSVLNDNVNGLFLCELPTGYGKTYTITNCMREYAANPNNTRKIIYLTTLNKNLPEEDLKRAYNDEKLYNKEVLRIRSNFDEVVDKIPVLDIPEEFISAEYYELEKTIRNYTKIKNSNINDTQYQQMLVDNVNRAERNFRHFVSDTLKKRFSNKKDKLKAIKNDANYKWIGALYPAVFTDERKIILMSISKFMKRNSVIVEPSYEFIKSPLFTDSIIIIDEFDATKSTIENELIERAVSVRENYISVFRQILRTLNTDYFSNNLKKAIDSIDYSKGNIITFAKLKKEADEIADKYHTNLSIKVNENHIDRKQNFLFKDATYHSILNGNAKYIRATKDKEENIVKVFFEDKKTFFENRKKDDIVIYSLLRDINRFLLHFRRFLFHWANEYMNIINNGRPFNADAMTIENAISTIVKKLELSNNQSKLLLGELCEQKINQKEKHNIPDDSFYQKGIEIFEFEDSDSHFDFTNLRFIKLYDTPEKIIGYISKHNAVIGLSATAEIPTVVGNYNLDYLRNYLENDFHSTPEDMKDRVKKQMFRLYEPYKDKGISLSTEVISTEYSESRSEDICRELFGNNDFAMICGNIIDNECEEIYYRIRYCNILYAMVSFIKNTTLKSMLYLGMALPEENKASMNYNLLLGLMEKAILFCGLNYNATDTLFVLKSKNFEEDKKVLINKLEQGEKILIISSYSTIGAGQNLQYAVTDKTNYIELAECKNPKDKRHFTKDIDALYLGNITNLTTNIYTDEKITVNQLISMLVQIESLYENGEIKRSQLNSLIRTAFNSYSTGHTYENNELYKIKSIRMQATREVIQAVGRMCRTFVKNRNINIYIEDKLLEKIYSGELRKRIMSPELEAIAVLRETLGSDYSDERQRILNTAEKISSTGMWTIKGLLYRKWNERSMQIWHELRELVLTFPTANQSQYNADYNLKMLYITAGKKINKYLYSQYYDFDDVIIDFGTSKIDFQNSGRAKMKGITNETIIYEAGEKNSYLPYAMKYSGMREHFIKLCYATTFEKNMYMMSPVLFHNIYKGALGEVCGEFILSRERGMKLKLINDPDRFEFFDFELNDGIYVDFKNWKPTYLQDRESTTERIRQKLDTIKGKRAYIINLVGNNNTKPTISCDGKIVEIPGLIDQDGKPITTNINMIRSEDFL